MFIKHALKIREQEFLSHGIHFVVIYVINTGTFRGMYLYHKHVINFYIIKGIVILERIPTFVTDTL